MNILILGLGNLLLSDEGVGVHAVNALGRRFQMPEGVEILDGGTSGMDLLDTISGRDHLIVCDAIRSDERPGSVHRIEGESITAFFATRISPHQLGLSEVLANLELLGERPRHVTIIGIVPADLSLGTELSAAGREGMEKCIDLIFDDLAAIGVRFTSDPLAATGSG
jgi:hydrogenase maturation protease